MATSEAQSKSLIFQAQELVANQLNLCPALSATPFYPEDMLDIEFQIRDALDRQGIACTVMTPALNYQGRCAYTTAWDFNNLQLVVVENPQINRARDNAMTALDVAYIATDWLCGPTSSTKNQFAPVSIKQGEEGKLVVVTVELKGLLHDTSDEPPPPVFPYRQVMIFNDGSIVPILYASSPEQVDVTINEPNTGLNRDKMVELAMYGNIGDAAFAGSTNLKRVYIDPTVDHIGTDAFLMCGGLEQMYFKGRTLAQVQAMDNYPWGIEDTSIIQADEAPTHHVDWTVQNGSTSAQFGNYHAGDEIEFTADEGYRYVQWRLNDGEEYTGDVRDGKWTYTVQDITQQHLRIMFSMYEP